MEDTGGSWMMVYSSQGPAIDLWSCFIRFLVASMPSVTCFGDLLKLGWSKNGEKSYLRPNNKKVCRRGDLTVNERNEFGNILFPVK